ncbi:MAG TPA: ATPase inhibitor subunit zeta [Beijerinckiaceae bacterium]|jgi:hypothetical protein
MTMFEERERAFEAMYAQALEREFIAACRGARLLAEWAAETLPARDAAAYVAEVLQIECEQGAAGVLAKIGRDLPQYSERRLQRMFETFRAASHEPAARAPR